MNGKGSQISSFKVYKNTDEFKLISHIHQPSEERSIFLWLVFKDKECSDPISVKQMLFL